MDIVDKARNVVRALGRGEVDTAETLRGLEEMRLSQDQLQEALRAKADDLSGLMEANDWDLRATAQYFGKNPKTIDRWLKSQELIPSEASALILNIGRHR